ncbi:MAG: MerR family transcriptional regulator [Eubacteriales bacterium]
MHRINTYSTSEVAGMIGIHPNTVRMYEDLELISKPLRKENGYRIFTDLHIDQFKLARMAFKIEVLQNCLRKKAVSIVKQSAICNFDLAVRQTEDYISCIQDEIRNAFEAIKVTNGLLHGSNNADHLSLKRQQVSDMLGISSDTLRNWEMNGLLKVRRIENGYRVYTEEDIRKLKIIRSLKCANYSLAAILRMMLELNRNSEADVQDVLNTPGEDEAIISVCDRLILSLHCAKENAEAMKFMLLEMKNKYSKF